MSADKLLKKIKDENIKFVDLRFTDPRGKMQHVTFHSDLVDEDLFQDGTMFDGSSIGGWKDINESDMVLLPDASTAKKFFVFDDVRWDTDQNVTGYSIDSSELPQNTGTQYQGGNMGHRPGPKGGYFPVPPVDSAQDMRGDGRAWPAS